MKNAFRLHSSWHEKTRNEYSRIMNETRTRWQTGVNNIDCKCQSQSRKKGRYSFIWKCRREFYILIHCQFLFSATIILKSGWCPYGLCEFPGTDIFGAVECLFGCIFYSTHLWSIIKDFVNIAMKCILIHDGAQRCCSQCHITWTQENYAAFEEWKDALN